MRLQSILKLGCVAALLALMLPAAAPAQAITAAIGNFYATCGTFSVDVAVNGTNNDSNGFDRFRYLIVDGGGKKLYQEDTFRQVNVTAGSMVINMSLDSDGVDGAPGINPIRFQVVELDANATPQSVIREVSYDASCLPATGTATITGAFRPPDVTRAVFLTTSPIYQSPNGQQIQGLSVQQGREHFAVYRSVDSRWVAVDVGGSDIVWVPVSNVRVDLTRLGLLPTRIDLANPRVPGGAQPLPPTTLGTPTPMPGGVVIPGTFTTGTVTARVRLRAFPSLEGQILTRVPANTVIPIFGRSLDGAWLRTVYLGYLGWVSSGFVRLDIYTLYDLPVVQ